MLATLLSSFCVDRGSTLGSGFNFLRLLIPSSVLHVTTFGSLVRGLRQDVLAWAPDGIDRELTASTIRGRDPVTHSAQRDSARPLRKEPSKQAFRIGTRTCPDTFHSQWLSHQSTRIQIALAVCPVPDSRYRTCS